MQAALGEDELSAPKIPAQVDGLYDGKFSRFGSAFTSKNARNLREISVLCFALDLLALEQGFRYLYESAAAETLIRRILAIQEADRLDNWEVADEIEIAPHGRLLLPQSLRTKVRKGVTDEARLRKKGGSHASA